MTKPLRVPTVPSSVDNPRERSFLIAVRDTLLSASESIEKLTGYWNIESWIEVGKAGSPVFENGWSNLGSNTAETAAFCKTQDGIVIIRGGIAGGTIGSAPVFRLPEKYRPTRDIQFPIVSNGAFGVMKIKSTGEVSVESGSSTSAYIYASYRV